MIKDLLQLHLARQKRLRTFFLPGMLFLALLCASCDASSLSQQSGQSTTSFTGSSTQQEITYSTNANDVLLRTFYGGGLRGTFNLGPQLSIYGDGTYIIGLDRQGKLDAASLQQLIGTLVDTYGLLDLTRLQFSDIPDQDATFLDLHINGKQEELMYGTFGSQSASAQNKDEYQRLGKALTTITNTLKGPFTPYQGYSVALLARQMFSPDLTQTIPLWPIADYTLDQAATFECGLLIQDPNSTNPETACLKFTIPSNAILLTTTQLRSIQEQLHGKQQGTFYELGLYYTVILRPLLPDELLTKKLAMFGSSQWQFIAVPLREGSVPPVPTATPSS